jgi:hypothetical protein
VSEEEYEAGKQAQCDLSPNAGITAKQKES